MSCGNLFRRSRQTEKPAGRECEVRLVERVKMKPLEAVSAKLIDLLNENGRGDGFPALNVLVETVVETAQTLRHGRTVACRHSEDALEIRGRHEAGDDGNVEASRRHAIAKAHDRIRAEAEISDGARSARVDLARQKIDVGFQRCGFRMDLRRARHADLEWRNGLDPRNQFGRRLITRRM